MLYSTHILLPGGSRLVSLETTTQRARIVLPTLGFVIIQDSYIGRIITRRILCKRDIYDCLDANDQLTP